MIAILLFSFAGILNSCMDVVRFKLDTSIIKRFKKSQWVNPSLSWKNKWKNGDSTQGEKFFGSSTFLVFLTDFWHLCKFLMIIMICLGTVLYQPIMNWYIDFFIFYLAFTVSFEIFYRF